MCAKGHVSQAEESAQIWGGVLLPRHQVFGVSKGESWCWGLARHLSGLWNIPFTLLHAGYTKHRPASRGEVLERTGQKWALSSSTGDESHWTGSFYKDADQSDAWEGDLLCCHSAVARVFLVWTLSLGR